MRAGLTTARRFLLAIAAVAALVVAGSSPLAAQAAPRTGAADAPIEITLGPGDSRWIALGQSVHYTFLLFNTPFRVGIAPVGGGAPQVCPGNVCTPTAKGYYVVTGIYNDGSSGPTTLLSVGDPDSCVVNGPQRTCTRTFSSADDHTFTVPDYVRSIHVLAIGGDGGSKLNGSGSPAGRGAVVEADLDVFEGEDLHLVVGGLGHVGGGRLHNAGNAYNGGGRGADDGAGGGGASDVRTYPASTPITRTSDSRLLVAAGGGGGANGAPGGDAGAAGGDSHDPTLPGTGGTAGAALAPGVPGGDDDCIGCGGDYGGVDFYFDGAGGGGGVHGGGYGDNAGAGGGSSLVPGTGTLGLNTVSAAPKIEITYTEPTPDPQLYDDLSDGTVAAGRAVHFHVAIPDDGPTVDGYTYSIAPTAGTTCTGDACTATVAGTYTATATKGSSTLATTFTVSAATPVAVTIAPSTAEVRVGSTVHYTVTRRDTYGNDAGAVTPAPDQSNALRETHGKPAYTDLCNGFDCEFPLGGSWTVAYDQAGMAASATVTVLGGPRIVPHLTSAAKRRNGYYPGPVVVSYSCSGDGTITAACPTPVLLKTTGTHRVHGHFGTQYGDAYSNIVVLVDVTAPKVVIGGVRPGATYTRAPTPTCRASDVGSGVESCRLTRTRIGAHTYRVVALAVDRAGNRTQVSVDYRLR